MSWNRLLLDTHVFLWARAHDPRLEGQAGEAIVQAGIVFVSAASAWEAAVKTALGKLRIPEPFRVGVKDSGFDQLPVTFAHAEEAGRLPPHHADPFDRMLIAQARIERLTLVTADRLFGRYDVDILMV